MAVDMIARLMAMGNSGGTADAYTKDETDALLAAKADESYVDGIADMVIDKMQMWADYTQAYETQMALKRQELNQVLNDQTKTQEEKDKVRQDFTKQQRYLELVSAKNAEIQTTGSVPASFAIEAQSANSGLYTWSADSKIYPVIVNCPLNSQLVTETWTFATSEHFEIKMSLPQRGNDTNRMIPFGTLDPPSTTSGYWGVKQDTSGTWLYTWKVRFEDTKGSLTAKEWTFDYTSSSVYAPIMQVSGSVPTITAGGQVPCGSTMSGIPFLCGQLITVSMPEATVTEPWDYYNNYVLPDLAAGNAAFPTGYTPTPKATFYTKDETDELLEDVEEEIGDLLDGKADIIDGKVPASQLPSYVDDTVEGYYYNGDFYEDSEHTTVITGESGKIYIDLTANKSYRWTGTVYVRIDECPAFGETAGTIYEGNKGKQNADNIGTMSSLTTTAKSSLVAAINELNDGKADKSTTYNKAEVNARVSALASESGSLADRGAKNLAKFDIWADQCTLVRGTKAIGSDGSITITATSSDCYTLFGPSEFPEGCRIPVIPGQEIVATWSASETGTGNKYVYFFPDGSATGSVAAKASDGIKRFTVPDGCTYITWRIGCSTSGDTLTFNNLMICTAADYDASSAYKPYAPTNRELYEMILAMQAGT